MKFRSILVATFGLCLGALCSAQPPYDSRGYAGMQLRADHAGVNYWDYGFEGIYHRPIGKGRFWLNQKVYGLSAANHGRNGTFSFQGPINLLSWLFIRSAAGKEVNWFEACNSPVFAVISLPSSQLDYALTDHLFAGVSNNTEYILARGHTGQKGIAYTPALTISYWGYPNSESFDAAGIQLQFGRTLFWNFEGKNRAEGWTVGLLLVFGYHI